MATASLASNLSFGQVNLRGIGGEKLWLCPTLGGDKLDLSGFGNHGTYNGGMGTVADTTSGGSRCYSFDGSDDYVDVDNGITFGGHSVACWVYADVTSLRMRFIDSYDKTVSTTVPHNVIQHEANTGIRAFSQISGNAITSYTSINALQWYHIASVLDGSALKFYINGSLVDTVSYTQTPNADWLRVGARNNGSELVDGRMDDIRAFDRALTTSEIKHLASKRGVLGSPKWPFATQRRIFVPATPAPAATTKTISVKKPKPSFATGYARNASESANPNLWKGLVGAWMPMMGQGGWNLQDISGRSNDADLYGRITPSKVSAIDGVRAVNLDAGSDYYKIDKVTDFSPAKVTYSVWMIPTFTATTHYVGGVWRQGRRAWVIRTDNGIATWFTSTDGSSIDSAVCTTSYVNNKLINYTGTYDGLKSRIYVNGNLEAETSVSGDLFDSQTEFSMGDILFYGSSSPFGGSWNGYIAGQMVHNRALSPTEIKQLYLNPAAPFERKAQNLAVPAAQVTPSGVFNPFSVLSHPLEQ